MLNDSTLCSELILTSMNKIDIFPTGAFLQFRQETGLLASSYPRWSGSRNLPSGPDDSLNLRRGVVAIIFVD